MLGMDEKALLIKALKKKLAKLAMEDGAGVAEAEMEGAEGDISNMERGANNMEEDAREAAEVEQAVDGEDGEKEVSIEIEAEGDAGSMEDLYKRMADEFGSMPESRKAAGAKKGMRGGSVSEMLKGKRGKRG